MLVVKVLELYEITGRCRSIAVRMEAIPRKCALDGPSNTRRKGIDDRCTPDMLLAEEHNRGRR